MGTRADFYVGRGKDAEWLGSIAWDGYRDGIDAQILQCQSAQAFRHAVATFLASRDDATLPAQGWPWPWNDSRLTDCVYAFFDDRAWQEFDGKWYPAEREIDYDDAGNAPVGGVDVGAWPDMSGRKNVALSGNRSGLIVIGL